MSAAEINPAKIGIKDIKEALLAQLPSVLHDLGVDLSGARLRGTYYLISSPLPGRKDKNPSFQIWMAGRAKGGWKAHNEGAHSGDIIDLIVEMGAARDKRDARQWGLHYLGWDSLGAKGFTQKELAAQRADRARAEQRAARAYAKKLKADRGRALGLWSKLARGIKGTSGAVYFRQARGIDISYFDPQPGFMRFDPAHYYSPRDCAYPAIVSVVNGPAGEIYGIHRIYLEPDCTQKLNVSAGDGEAARMVWPSYTGGVIRIHRGDSKLNPEEANRRVLGGDMRHCRPVVVVEGVEDGLAVRLAYPEMRIWAAVSLGNLSNVPDMPCVSEFIVWQDNDWDKPAAVAAFYRAVDQIRAHGKPVKIARAHIGKDANDVLKAGMDSEPQNFNPENHDSYGD